MTEPPQTVDALRPKDRLVSALHGGILSMVRTEEPDLNLRQLGVLLVCAYVERPETVKSLTAKLQTGKPAITRALDRLAAAGLVRRLRNPSDGRSVLIEVTKTGHTLCRRLANAAKIR
jgi:DNA-binding MarR family transcriptional regulator